MFLYPLSRMTGGIYYEHSHRLFGALVGLGVVVLAVYLQRVERQIWVKRLGWSAVFLVVLQGVLGGLRVTGRFTWSGAPEAVSPNVTLAAVHGVLGQVVFAVLTAIAVCTSPHWQGSAERGRRSSARTTLTLPALLLALLLGQLAVGAVLRHLGWGLHLHVAGAVGVLVVGIFAGLQAWGLHPEEAALRRTGLGLVVAVCLQATLGLAAYLARGFPASWHPAATSVAVTTAHQTGGALTTMFAVALALWTWRLAPPRAAG